MIEYTVTQLHYLAGVDRGDSDFVQDVKLSGWLAGSKYRIITADRYGQERDWAIDDGIEVLIIKD